MMNAEPKTELLFRQAVKLSASERAAFLAKACGSDPKLLERIGLLLAAHEKSGGVLPEEGEERRVPTVTAESPSSEGEGAQIGRYKLLEKLGEGGFGSVWAAEQREPVRRRVALKIIKLGMDTKQVVARFEAERQALALMEHPNIAKVLDAGATETGRPYFVMELVKGIPITKYCVQQKLETKARLDLFIKVCHAIQHAHQKGIIHRDIKPSNIMVALHDGAPVPKVIDFGIAKATQQELTERTIYTQFNQFIGTPAYMSPEQAEMSGLDIDTRSDIYSLGVLLYELLTGTTPFDTKELMSSGLDEMRKIIREREPIRPSTRLNQTVSAGATQGLDEPRIGKGKSAIDRDLDWIVMKCLEKDRTRRYETANGLSMDLKRHLDHEPIIARPPSTGYRLRKAWQRNKVAFAAMAVVAVALIAGGGISSWQAAVAKKARRAEERQRMAAEESSRQAIANASRAETQRNIAEENARKAEAAIKLAEEREAQMLRRAYAADLNLAHQSIKNNNLGRALGLLNRYRPRPGETDLRGWEWRYLWSLCRSDAAFELCRFAEDDPVLSTAISPDGKSVALGGGGGVGVRVWNIAERREIAQLAEGESFCRVAFSPDGRWLAWASQAEIRLWDCARREIVAKVRADRTVVSIGFSGDGQRVVTFSESDGITVWDTTSLRRLKKHSAPYGHAWLGTPFAFSPDLKVAVRVEGWDSIVAMDLESGEERWRRQSEHGFSQALAISPDGKWLASGFGLTDGTVYLFEMATGRQAAVLPGHRAWISSLIFFPDGTKLASASADQTIRIWNLETRETLRVLQGHKLEIWSMALSPEAGTLISGGKDGSVLVWDTRADKKEENHFRLPGEHRAWAFSKDGKGVLTVEGDNVRTFQWTGENEAKALAVPMIGLEKNTGFTNGSSCAFSPSGSRVVVLATNGILQVWDAASGSSITEVPTGTDRSRLFSFSGDDARVWLSRRSASNAWLIDLAEWDLDRRQLLRTIPGVSWPFAMAPDRWLFSGLHTGWIRDLQSGQTYSPLMFEGRLSTLHGNPAFSRDGEHLVVSHDTGVLTVWKTKDLVTSPNPKPVRTLGGILMSFSSASFSPDGSRLFGTSHGSEAIKIWETTTYHELLTLEANAEIFGYPGMSADGRNLVASAGGKVFVWRAASWEEIERAEKLEKAED